MPPSSSVSPNPVLLTDQFCLNLTNGTNNFNSNDDTASGTQMNDELIAGVVLGVLAFPFLVTICGN